MTEPNEPAPAPEPVKSKMLLDDRVDAVVERIAAALKKLGFKRSKRIFRREVDTKGQANNKAIQIVELQSSTAGSQSVLDVSLGVYWKEFVSILTPWKTKPPAAPREVDGQVRLPIGALGPEGPEHRYRLADESADAEVAARIEQAVLERGVPFLERAVDPPTIARGEVPGADPFLVILCQSRLGQKDAAQAALAKLAVDRPKEFIVVASFAGRLKLKPPPRP